MIKKVLLVNVLVSGFYIPAFVINVVDCTNCLVEGEEKDGPFIANLFITMFISLTTLLTNFFQQHPFRENSFPDQMSLLCIWIRFNAQTTRNFHLPVKGSQQRL